MGVLDRLDAEVREARERRAAAASAKSTRQAAVAARLAPALERAAGYLERLASRLGELDRAIVARYVVEGVGVLDDLRQGEYRFTRADDGSGTIRLRFTCRGARALAVSVDGHAQAQSLARSVGEAGLGCQLEPLSARVMKLRVEPRFPVTIAVAPDAAHGTVHLELRNLDQLGVQRYGLSPERVDEALLDALARLVLREPSDFAHLTGSVVDGEQRADLRRTLGRDRRRRDAELAGGWRRLVFPVTEWFRRAFMGG